MASSNFIFVFVFLIAPQGSIFSPFFFQIYISNLSNLKISEVKQLADNNIYIYIYIYIYTYIYYYIIYIHM